MAFSFQFEYYIYSSPDGLFVVVRRVKSSFCETNFAHNSSKEGIFVLPKGEKMNVKNTKNEPLTAGAALYHGPNCYT